MRASPPAWLSYCKATAAWHLRGRSKPCKGTTNKRKQQGTSEVDIHRDLTGGIGGQAGSGNAQGLLVLDFNQNGLIETRDISNLGGNTGHATEGASQPGNPTDEARLATQNADLQRNNVAWLDANGDGQLTASDPAFAAIKLWIDVNQDGQMQAGEGQSLAAQQISSINFRTGQITYADGHSDALTATTLKADTEGVKFTQINEVNPGGTLHTLDAGTVLEHEGYQGKVQITDEGGTRWASEREQTYEQQAKRTGAGASLNAANTPQYLQSA